MRGFISLLILLASPALAGPVTRPATLPRAGWNVWSTRFMYTPSFQVTAPSGAVRFILTIRDSAGRNRSTFSDTPTIDTSSLWPELPAANRYSAWIEALDAGGKLLARTDVFSFHKVAPFAGPYPPAARSYRESGRACARYVLKTLSDSKLTAPGTQRAVDFPALFYSAYIRVLITYAADDPSSPAARDALDLARKFGRNLIATSTPSNWAYADMPLSHKPGQYLQVSRTAMVGLSRSMHIQRCSFACASR